MPELAERRRQSSIAPVPDLTRNAVDVLPEGRLAEQLAGGRPLRVKLGIDPTTADIHLGHTVVLEKLREFQDAGHTVVLIIGDFTARVGDPSGRSAQRPLPSPEEIEANAATYQEQAFKVLDRERTEVRFNSEWLRMEPEELLGLLAQTTVARLLERDDFQKRLAAGRADRGARAALPAAAGLRLGRGRGRRRAGGDRPEVQPALRPRRPGRLRPEAAVDPDDADPGRHRRRAEDEQVARQLRRRHRGAGGDVRQADEHPRRGDGRVLPPAARRARCRRAPPERGQAGARGRGSSSASTARRPATAAEEHFDRLFVQRTRRRRRSRRSSWAPTSAATATSVHLPR